jgi:hypothetical protein
VDCGAVETYVTAIADTRFRSLPTVERSVFSERLQNLTFGAPKMGMFEEDVPGIEVAQEPA